MPMAQVSRWRDGRMVYAKGYADREEALRDRASLRMTSSALICDVER